MNTPMNSTAAADATADAATITPQPQARTLQRKIGSNKGKPRLWIEGKALIEAGLPHGTRWDLVSASQGALCITANEKGSRKVAGSPDRPVIDVTASSLDPLRDAQGDMPATVTITFNPGQGCLHVTSDLI